MPRKDKASYQEYMREYMRAKRQGLTGINKDLNVGARGFEPPTSWSQTMRANHCATPRDLKLKSCLLPISSRISYICWHPSQRLPWWLRTFCPCT